MLNLQKLAKQRIANCSSDWEPLLLQCAEKLADVSFDRVRASLRGVQAKVWIDEAENPDQWSAPALKYEPWEFDSPDGEGLQAPVGTLLLVKGAWLDADGVEQIDPEKADRSFRLDKSGTV